MSKKPTSKKTSSTKKVSLEDSINSTNPISLFKEFLGGVYQIIDDALTTYEAVYNVIDKITDDTICNTTIPSVIENICSIQTKFEVLGKSLEEFPKILAKKLSELTFLINYALMEGIINLISNRLKRIKDKIEQDFKNTLKITLGPSAPDLSICKNAKVIAGEICVHLKKVNKNFLIKFIKNVGRILVIFKRNFNKLEPLFNLEYGNPIRALTEIKKASTGFTQELVENKKELDEEVQNLSDNFKKLNAQPSLLTPGAPLALTGGKQKSTNINYQVIIDPKTSNAYSINSKQATRILNSYKKLLNL